MTEASEHPSKSDVERLFRADLAELLGKWGATIEAEDHYPGYPECGQDIRIEVDIPSIWTGGELVRPGITINFGSMVDPP